jgi:hypothetical protein
MFDESKSQYVSRKVEAFTKDYRHTHEKEGLDIDADEFRHLTLETRYAAEDWYDFWNGTP